MSERSYDERPSAPPQTPPSGVQNRREHVSRCLPPEGVLGGVPREKRCRQILFQTWRHKWRIAVGGDGCPDFNH